MSETAQATTSRVWAYLELARISNLPTVWSNVLVGCALGATAGAATPNGGIVPFPWRAALALAMAMSSFYIAGMVLNDVMDVAVDRLERPSRPIPSGRVSRRSATVVAVALLGAGMLIVALVNVQALPPATMLLLLILAYDAAHRRYAALVVLLGVCRMMVYQISAVAICWPLPQPLPLSNAAIPATMLIYVVILSLIARREAGNPRRIRIVLVLLAGISLLDAVFLVGLRMIVPALVAVACFALTRIGHRWIKGT
ncbi:MAG: UbiA family prenyltransferase [Phycisphaeraceae bacterium]